MNPMHEHQLPHDELAWQAFRYIAGEMNAAEQERFDAQLAADQAAREAVAAAVEISRATAIALAPQPAPAPRTTGPRRWPLVGWGVAAAACLAMAFGWMPLGERSSPSQLAQTEALAMQWSEIRQRQALPHDESLAASPPDEWTDEFDDAEPAEESPAVAPEWMLAAVLEMHSSETMPEMPGEIERRTEESREQ